MNKILLIKSHDLFEHQDEYKKIVEECENKFGEFEFIKSNYLIATMNDLMDKSFKNASPYLLMLMNILIDYARESVKTDEEIKFVFAYNEYKSEWMMMLQTLLESAKIEPFIINI